MATQHNSGSQACTVTTEHFLGTDPDTTTGAFQFCIETSAFVRGDTFELRVYEKINDTGDTARQVKKWTFYNEQDDLLFISEAFLFVIGFRFSIKQTTGTSRTVQWSIRKA